MTTPSLYIEHSLVYHPVSLMASGRLKIHVIVGKEGLRPLEPLAKSANNVTLSEAKGLGWRVN